MIPESPYDAAFKSIGWSCQKVNYRLYWRFSRVTESTSNWDGKIRGQAHLFGKWFFVFRKPQKFSGFVNGERNLLADEPLDDPFKQFEREFKVRAELINGWYRIVSVGLRSKHIVLNDTAWYPSKAEAEASAYKNGYEIEK